MTRLWRQCPEFQIDLNKGPQPSDIPSGFVGSAKELLTATLKDLPSTLRILADLARLRTFGRFHREVVQ